VHGVAVDTKTNHVFVNDRGNKRAQVFDENGKYLYEWSFGTGETDIHTFIITADNMLWAFDRGTSKMLKYDLEGHFLYSWGTWGEFPGGFWGVHGITSDPDGNFYTAAVDSGGGQKFTPRPGARPEVLVGKPLPRVWK
jgi:DNA-binding beta-propeller fold protein YncE